MFGHKKARSLETEPRSQVRGDPVKSPTARQMTETWSAKNPVEARTRKEMYFAVASTFRWSQ